jgi:hypothetical protein
MERPTLTDVDWVRRGRQHVAAGRLILARECFDRALNINPENRVARKRLAELPLERELLTAYTSGCLVCGLSITSVIDERCAECRYFKCPRGHCACTDVRYVRRRQE